MQQIIYTCDHCRRQTQESGIVSSVEITYGGHGAARDKVDGIDLCRECFGDVARAIRDLTKIKAAS